MSSRIALTGAATAAIASLLLTASPAATAEPQSSGAESPRVTVLSGSDSPTTATATPQRARELAAHPDFAPDERLRRLARKTDSVSKKQTFTEASSAFAWERQKHWVTVRDGKAHHQWVNIDDNTDGADTLPGTDYVGEPIGFSADGQQHYFVRTSSGAIKHAFWGVGFPGIATDTWVDGGALSDPAGAVIGRQQHLFYVDTSNTLRHVWWDPAAGTLSRDAWSSPSEDTKLVGTPTLFTWRGEQHVFVRTEDGRIIHYYWVPGGNGIIHDEWVSGSADSDPSAIVGDDHQSIFYVSDGRLMRKAWVPSKLTFDTSSWTKGAFGGDVAAVGKPEVFGVYDQLHAITRNVDGSVTHHFNTPKNPTGVSHEWVPSGNVTEPVTAALLFGDQDLFFTYTDGQRGHMWWSPQSKKVHYQERGAKTPASPFKSVPLNKASHFAVSGIDGKRVCLTEMTAEGVAEVYCSTPNEQFPAGVTSDSYGTDVKMTGNAPLWPAKDGGINLGILAEDGITGWLIDIKPGGEGDVSAGAGAFHVVEGVESTTLSGDARQTVLAARDDHGILVALVQEDGTPRWTSLRDTGNVSKLTIAEAGNTGSVRIAGVTPENGVKWFTVDTSHPAVVKSRTLSTVGGEKVDDVTAWQTSDGTDALVVRSATGAVRVVSPSADNADEAFTHVPGVIADTPVEVSADYTTGKTMLSTTDSTGVLYVAVLDAAGSVLTPFTPYMREDGTSLTVSSNAVFVSHPVAAKEGVFITRTDDGSLVALSLAGIAPTPQPADPTEPTEPAEPETPEEPAKPTEPQPNVEG